MAVYKWNVIDLDLAQEIFEGYINKDPEYSGKVIEIQCMYDVFSNSGRRYYLDAYSKKKDYMKYDMMTKRVLESMGIDQESMEKSWELLDSKGIPNMVILEQGSNNDILDEIASSLTLSEKNSVFAKILLNPDPQIKFLPIQDSIMWKEIWNRLFIGDETQELSLGFWFTKESDGKFKVKHDPSDWKGTKYFRIRSLDYPDYKDEIDNILGGSKEFLTSEGITKESLSCDII